MMTAKKPSKPAKPAPVPVPMAETTDVDMTAEKLLHGASEVRVRINWFGTSAKVSDEIAEDMLKDTGAERSSVSISKRLLRTKNEALLRVKEARKMIEDHIRAWTIPMMALKVAAIGATTEEGLTRKDAGIRLIQKKDMAEFDQRLTYLIGLLQTAAKGLQNALPEIKAEDQERLGSMFKDSDYPTDVVKLIGVERSYKQVGADIDWQEMCPEIYERERLNAKKRFEAVVENAATEFADRFVKYVKQTADQLGNRSRLNPLDGKRMVMVTTLDGAEASVSVADAELLTVLEHEDEPDEIPEGHVLCQLRLDKGEQKGRSTEVWFAKPMKKIDCFTNLRPYTTNERRKLYASTIDNLKQELETFLNIGNMLGPYKDIIANSVATVKHMLSKASDNLDTNKISAELRSEVFRKDMKTALAGVATKITDAMTDAKEKRRSIKRSLVGKFGEE